MKPIRNIFVLAFALLLFMAGQSTGGASATTGSEDFFYVSPHDLPPELLTTPPPQYSPVEHQQIEAVKAAQQHLSEKEIKEIREEQNIRVELMTKIIGAHLNRDHYPRTYLLLDHVFADTETITRNDKNFWHRKRPYLLDSKIKLLVDPLDKSPSYPSGHACDSRVLAEVLGMLYPNHRDQLRARAESIAEHRVEAGVHTPLDIEAGRLLAMQITGALIENEDFQIDLLAAHEEILTHP